MKKSYNIPVHEMFQLEALEPRIMWDATGLEGSSPAPTQTEAVPLLVDSAEDGAEVSEPETDVEAEDPKVKNNLRDVSGSIAVDQEGSNNPIEGSGEIDSETLLVQEVIFDPHHADLAFQETPHGDDLGLNLALHGFGDLIVDGEINMDVFFPGVAIKIPPNESIPRPSSILLCGNQKEIETNPVCMSVLANQRAFELNVPENGFQLQPGIAKILLSDSTAQTEVTADEGNFHPSHMMNRTLLRFQITSENIPMALPGTSNFRHESLSPHDLSFISLKDFQFVKVPFFLAEVPHSSLFHNFEGQSRTDLDLEGFTLSLRLFDDLLDLRVSDTGDHLTSIPYAR